MDFSVFLRLIIISYNHIEFNLLKKNFLSISSKAQFPSELRGKKSWRGGGGEFNLIHPKRTNFTQKMSPKKDKFHPKRINSTQKMSTIWVDHFLGGGIATPVTPRQNLWGKVINFPFIVLVCNIR